MATKPHETRRAAAVIAQARAALAAEQARVKLAELVLADVGFWYEQLKVYALWGGRDLDPGARVVMRMLDKILPDAPREIRQKALEPQQRQGRVLIQVITNRDGAELQRGTAQARLSAEEKRGAIVTTAADVEEDEEAGENSEAADDRVQDERERDSVPQ